MKILVVQTPHYDALSATIIQGLKKLEANKEIEEVRCVEDSNYSNDKMETGASIRYGRKADLIVLSSNCDVNEGLIDSIGRLEKTVYIDGEDAGDYRKSPSDFPLYFKKEKRLGVDHPQNVIALPIAIEDRFLLPFDYRKKNKEVVCMLGLCEHTKPWRTEIDERVRIADYENSFVGQLYGGSKTDTANTKRQHDDYMSMMTNAKRSIDALGAYGANCFRFWESLATGCCLFCQQLEIPIPRNSFIEGKHYIVYKDGKDLVEKLDKHIESGDWMDMASEAHEFAKKYHLTENRAQYFLSVCSERL